MPEFTDPEKTEPVPDDEFNIQHLFNDKYPHTENKAVQDYLLVKNAATQWPMWKRIVVVSFVIITILTLVYFAKSLTNSNKNNPSDQLKEIQAKYKPKFDSINAAIVIIRDSLSTSAFREAADKDTIAMLQKQRDENEIALENNRLQIINLKHYYDKKINAVLATYNGDSIAKFFTNRYGK